MLKSWAVHRLSEKGMKLVEPVRCVLLQSPVYFKANEIDSSKMYRTVQVLFKVLREGVEHEIKIMDIHLKPSCTWDAKSIQLVRTNYNVNLDTKSLFATFPIFWIDTNDFVSNPASYKDYLVFSGYDQMQSESKKVIGNRKGALVAKLESDKQRIQWFMKSVIEIGHKRLL